MADPPRWQPGLSAETNLTGETRLTSRVGPAYHDNEFAGQNSGGRQLSA
jgi:hypothetical protein